jgi:hypothetical protein
MRLRFARAVSEASGPITVSTTMAGRIQPTHLGSENYSRAPEGWTGRQRRPVQFFSGAALGRRCLSHRREPELRRWHAQQLVGRDREQVGLELVEDAERRRLRPLRPEDLVAGEVHEALVEALEGLDPARIGSFTAP